MARACLLFATPIVALSLLVWPLAAFWVMFAAGLAAGSGDWDEATHVNIAAITYPCWISVPFVAAWGIEQRAPAVACSLAVAVGALAAAVISLVVWPGAILPLLIISAATFSLALLVACSTGLYAAFRYVRGAGR
jgi:hypothetical protein